MVSLSKRASLAEQEIQRLFLRVIPGTAFAGKVFSVGGYERDAFMGKESKDLDLVVEMKGGAEQLAHFIKRLFPEETYTPRQLGAAYPIWHIGFKEDVSHGGELFRTKGGEIDIADTQKETYPDPTSRQRATEFATLPEDIQRRDFTVNMLLRDLSSGEAVDLTGSSKEDIQKGILRGHPLVSPDKMFSDDPLRMMRLIRFQVKYDWDVPLSMLRAVRRNAEQIQKISWERIQEELVKMMKLGKTGQAVRLMKTTGLLNYVLPEVYGLIGIGHDPSNHQEGDVYKHTLLVLSHAPPTVVGQLSALLHDVGKPQTREFLDGKIRFLGHEKASGEMAEAILRRLKFDTDVIRKVRRVVESHMRPIDLPAASPKALRKFVRDVGEETVEAVLQLAEADALGTLPPENYVPELRKKLEEAQKIPIAKTPILNGEEIMALLGIKPGPKIREVTTYLKELEDELAERGQTLDKETAKLKVMERFGPMKQAKFQLSKRAQMQVVIEPLDPAVQQAVQEVKRIAPETLQKVTKIVVHPSGGGGELGHVQMGPQNDPHEIHLFKDRIQQIARQQLGAGGGQIDPKVLAEAVRMALVETIAHEGAHIGGAKRTEEQIGKGPFFGEGEAEAKAKEVMQRERQVMPKAAFLLSRRAGMACPHCHEDVSHIKPEKTPAGLYKMLTCPHCGNAFYPQDAMLAIKEKGKKKTDIGDWPVFEWFAIDLFGMPLGYVKGEANANMMVDRIKREFVETGKFPDFGVRSEFVWRALEAEVKRRKVQSEDEEGRAEIIDPEKLCRDSARRFPLSKRAANRGK